jgi:hypothetical protein
MYALSYHLNFFFSKCLYYGCMYVLSTGFGYCEEVCSDIGGIVSQEDMDGCPHGQCAGMSLNEHTYSMYVCMHACENLRMYFHCVEDLENILLDSKLSFLNQKCVYCM